MKTISAFIFTLFFFLQSNANAALNCKLTSTTQEGKEGTSLWEKTSTLEECLTSAQRLLGTHARICYGRRSGCGSNAYYINEIIERVQYTFEGDSFRARGELQVKY